MTDRNIDKAISNIVEAKADAAHTFSNVSEKKVISLRPIRFTYLPFL